MVQPYGAAMFDEKAASVLLKVSMAAMGQTGVIPRR
jgi:hypothetical protein